MRRTLVLIVLLLQATLAVAGVCTASSPEEFAPFFSKFSDDKHFAVSRTVFPLRALKWEYGIDSQGKDESAPRRFRIPKAKYETTPSLSSSMKEHGLTSRVKGVSTRSAIVEVFKEGTDWLTSHHFKRIGRCWFLYEYQDHSL